MFSRFMILHQAKGSIYVICLALIMDKCFHIEVNTNGGNPKGYKLQYPLQCSRNNMHQRGGIQYFFHDPEDNMTHFCFSSRTTNNRMPALLLLEGQQIAVQFKELINHNGGTELDVFKKFSNSQHNGALALHFTVHNTMPLMIHSHPARCPTQRSQCQVIFLNARTLCVAYTVDKKNVSSIPFNITRRHATCFAHTKSLSSHLEITLILFLH